MSFLFSFTQKKPNPMPVSSLSDQWVEKTLSNLSFEEKVGQTLMWHIDEEELTSASAELLAKIPFGGVIIMGSHSGESLKKLTGQIHAIPAPVKRFIAIDQEGGSVKRLIDDPHPGARELSQISPEELCSTYQQTTRQLLESGINMNFGIVADTGWFENGFITPRTFGGAPDIVANFVGQALTCSVDILNTVKHFPGHGRTQLDSHKTIPVIQTSYAEWKQTDAIPFQRAIDTDVPVIMLGHLIYENMATVPASLSPYWTQELRNMGHKGLIITDDLGMLEKSGMEIDEIIEKAIQAKTDILLMVSLKEDPNVIWQKSMELWRNDALRDIELDTHVRRILMRKYEIQ